MKSKTKQYVRKYNRRYYLANKASKNAASRAWARRNRAKLTAMVRENRAKVSAIKLQRGCADCGYREHACALDFDHVRGKKSFTVAEKSANSLASLMQEIAKCDVVCSNCHRVRTLKRLHSKKRVLN